MRSFGNIALLCSVLIYVMSCTEAEVIGPEAVQGRDMSVMEPSLRHSAQKPAYATRALIDAASGGAMSANFLRLNEDIDGTEARGTYLKTWDTAPSTGKINWESAWLLEASSISSPDMEGRRSVFLNPVQSYYTRKISEDSYLYYKSLLVSWHPLNCILHKNSDGATAAITEFSTFRNQNKTDAYAVSDDGLVSINFTGLDGATDVMVSNAVEAQQWHEPDGVDDAVDYRLPFGHNEASPKYDNPLTYRHYLSAVRIHAYSEHSAQLSEMWGKILDVVVKDQPSACSVTLPYTIPVETPVASGLYSSAPGDAVFSGNTDFSLVKTKMYGDGSGVEDDIEAEHEPTLSGRNDVETSAYLGYALIRPDSSVTLEIHTETGVYEVKVQNLTDGEDNPIDDFTFEAGYIYDVYLNFQTLGRISGLLLNDGGYRYYDLTANTAFDVGGSSVEQYSTANCYIIHPDIMYDSNGDGLNDKYYDGYAFLATVAGNGDGGVLSGFDRSDASLEPKKAALLWESTQGLITQVELMYGYVRFRTPKPSDISRYKEGNAVIAVYDSDFNVLWSWHIWITDKPAEIQFDEKVTLLDRNIGATAAYAGATPESVMETYGLYYQWGRKDPFMGPPEYNFKPHSTTTAPYYDAYAHELTSVDVHTVARPSIADGVANPMYMILPVELSPYYQYDWLYDYRNNLWGYDFNNGLIQKTIYDPCPVGYRVPAESMNSIASTTAGRTVTSSGISYKNGTLFFPYAGYRGVDRGMSSMTCAWKYVGQKADYMLAKTLSSNHRSRIYMSYASYWTEVGTEGLSVFPYTGNVIEDGANRRGAGSVRCVKDVELGTIRSMISTDRRNYFAGETVSLTLSASVPPASSSEFMLTGAELYYAVATDLEVDSDGEIVGSLNWIKWTEDQEALTPSGYTWTPESLKIELSDIAGEVSKYCHIAFRLVVKNDMGLSLTKTYSINYYPIDIRIHTVGDGEELTGQSLYWYTSYNIRLSISGMGSLSGLDHLLVEGKEYDYTGNYMEIEQSGYLDNEFTILFMDSRDNVLLERTYKLSYTQVALHDQYAEYTGTVNDSGATESLVENGYYVILNRDDKSRHLSIDGSSTVGLTRDECSAYGVFRLVDLTSATYSSYSNVGGGRLQHLATGLYLTRSGSSIVLTANRSSATYFYFCSDWGTERSDNVDVLVRSGNSYYYMDSPGYSYIRLSTSGRDHYKWYIQRVVNPPAAQ